MTVTICYLLKSIKPVFILAQCNTSLSENYLAHSYATGVRVTGWIWEKNWFVCAFWLFVHMKSAIEQGFFPTNSHSTTKCWKHSSDFESGKIVLSSNFLEFEFELRHIPSCISILSLFSQCCLPKITTIHLKLKKVMHKKCSWRLICSSSNCHRLD